VFEDFPTRVEGKALGNRPLPRARAFRKGGLESRPASHILVARTRVGPAMRRRPTAAALALLLPAFLSGSWALASPTASPVLASPVAPPISGVVSHLERPIAGALVILYNLGDTSLSRSRTASDGTFVLASAPVGVYDLVAYKKGFVPALVRLWHQAPSEGISAVRIQLAARNEKAGGPDAVSSVWELREKVPADVLRELSIEAGAEPARAADNKIRMDRSLAGEVRTVAQAQGGDSS